MTTIERLIRNLCETKRGEVLQEQSAQLAEVPSSMAVSELPARLQHAVREHAKLSKRVKELAGVIDKAGYDAPRDACDCDGVGPLSIGTDYSARNRAQELIKQRGANRGMAIAKLRHDAHVACLGKSSQESKALLEKLQRDLAKV